MANLTMALLETIGDIQTALGMTEAEKSVCNGSEELVDRIDELRARIARLELSLAQSHALKEQWQALATEQEAECERLTAENAGLREDRERMDYMEMKGISSLSRSDTGNWWLWVPENQLHSAFDSLRSAVDAARGAQ